MEINPHNDEIANPNNDYSEAAMIKSLAEMTAGVTTAPTLQYTWDRHAEYDRNRDRTLTPDELFCIPSDELRALLAYSSHPDDEIIKSIAFLPNSKLSRLFAQPNDKSKIENIFLRFINEHNQRAIDILVGMKESPYYMNAYNVEGSRVYERLQHVPNDLRSELLSKLELVDPPFTSNIQRHDVIQPLSRYPRDFPPSGGSIEKEVYGNLPFFKKELNAQKVYQQQYAVVGRGANLQTFGVNDCIALGLVEDSGVKALTHLDVGMNIQDSIDTILLSFVKSGGDIAQAKAALVGGFDSSKDMIWLIKRRLQQAGITVSVSRLLTGESRQLLITDEGFFDFEWQGSEEDNIEFEKSADRIKRERGGRMVMEVGMPARKTHIDKDISLTNQNIINLFQKLKK